MRVIAGTARSIPLKTPKGEQTRPTTDRIKETLFNMINQDIAGSVFLDLFSGSGGIGIEALSRGAAKAYFVEKDTEACNCIKENIYKCRFTDNSVLLKQDASAAIMSSIKEHADIIFMDPPYNLDLEKKILDLLSRSSIIDSDSVIIIEALIDNDFSYAETFGYEIIKEKLYKTNKHVFLKKKECV